MCPVDKKIIQFSNYAGMFSACVSIGLAILSDGYSISALAIGVFYGLLFANAVIDAYTHTLIVWVTNATLVAAIAYGLCIYGLDWSWWQQVAQSLVLVCVPLGLASVISGGRYVGRGDVRLLAAMCFFHGREAVACFVVAIICAGAISLVGLVFRRLHFDSSVPFGPFLVGASWGVWASMSSLSLVQSVI